MIASLALAAALNGSAGIQGSNVCLNAPARPGQSYLLPVYVQNTGGSSETTGVAVSPLAPGEQVYRGEKQIAASWASAASVTLAPGQGGLARFTLAVPPSAPAGIYVANIYVTPASPASAGGMRAVTNAGGQTYLIFSVGVTPPSCATPPPPGSPWRSDYAPRQARPDTLSAAWMKQHEPRQYWYLRDINPYFGCPHATDPCHATRNPVTDPRTGGGTAAAQAATPAAFAAASSGRPAVPAAGGLAAAAVAAVVLVLLASRRKRGGSR